MDNWFRLFSRREVQTPGVPSTTAPTDAKPKGGNWEANVVRPYGRSSLLIPTWTRCVQLIMQTMGQMVTQYQRMNGEGGNFIEDRYGKNGILNYMLQVRPNPQDILRQCLRVYRARYRWLPRESLALHRWWL